MKERLFALGRYARDRLQESSTWRGVILIATACGAHLSDDAKELIAVVGLGIAGAVGVLFPDKKP